MHTRLFPLILCVSLLLAGGLVWSSLVTAAIQTAEIKGVGYNVQSSFEDNLKALVGKNIAITTVSGKQFSGTVRSVGTHLLHLERLEGKEYFDALIRLEQIAAIDTRFREPQR